MQTLLPPIETAGHPYNSAALPRSLWCNRGPVFETQCICISAQVLSILHFYWVLCLRITTETHRIVQYLTFCFGQFHCCIQTAHWAPENGIKDATSAIIRGYLYIIDDAAPFAVSTRCQRDGSCARKSSIYSFSIIQQHRHVMLLPTDWELHAAADVVA